eukprot:CAMPEP_0118710556 /NCGR_PEP_ID=MMETSP0800-20121206/23459_1 /TAXON_ID=210618 ORGANISM="Striatella unipunctata, Strain CCMP2910" /NCGR_SAMPLE_ID=MMETSP0800 /ASSEMBLY_ACC=CAM_ASM_000638 /LENGTH=352 /DNA_ID=CAMNT_0006614775 /DNA_START=276 /DNA_END=1334 /DNA_ORIENTATION=+
MGTKTEAQKKKGFKGLFSRKGPKKEQQKQELKKDNLGPESPPRLPRTVNAAPGSPTMSDISTSTGMKGQPQSGQGQTLLLPPMQNEDATIMDPSNDSLMMTSPIPRKGKGLKKKKLKTSFLSRSKYFKDLCDWAFSLIDTDGSGAVDEKELYSGLLLIHLKLATYAGPAACKPVSHQHVIEIFKKMDADDSGALDKDEFREVMMILCSNVFGRVMLQWALTLIIVPMLAQQILDGIYWIIEQAILFIQNLDEYSSFFNAIEIFIETKRDQLIAATPMVIRDGLGTAGKYLEMVPDSVWNSIPLTLISCILAMLVVPYLVFKTDDYFRKAAVDKVEEDDDDDDDDDDPKAKKD